MNETIKNLARAFVGESQARNRYTLYAQIAKDEGLSRIAEAFLVTADNEREHAKWNYLMMCDLLKKGGNDVSQVDIDVSVAAVLGDTRANLTEAIGGEQYETATMYPDFAAVAEDEGFGDVAKRMRAIGMAEEHHRKRYEKLLLELDGKSEAEKDEGMFWVCSVCGYVHEGDEAPERCPSCDSPHEKFERQDE